MPQLRFRSELSLGNLITILILIVTLAGGWSAMASDTAALKKRMDTVEVKVETIRNNSSDEKAKIAASLAALQTDVGYLRKAMDELRAAQGRK